MLPLIKDASLLRLRLKFLITHLLHLNEDCERIDWTDYRESETRYSMLSNNSVPGNENPEDYEATDAVARFSLALKRIRHDAEVELNMMSDLY